MKGDWSKFEFIRINDSDIDANGNDQGNKTFTIRCLGNGEALFANETSLDTAVDQQPWIRTINSTNEEIVLLGLQRQCLL